MSEKYRKSFVEKVINASNMVDLGVLTLGIITASASLAFAGSLSFTGGEVAKKLFVKKK